jgi:hypothetical protein
MKLIVLLTIFFLTAACGSSGSNANSSDGDELRADILIRPAPDQPVIEITFYRDISEVVNGKTNKGFGKNVVAVYDPLFNGIAMTNATNLSGQPIYKTDVANVKASNTITATVGGRTFEASVLLEPGRINNMRTVSLFPVEKVGS